MFRTPTVYILGAGASWHYGYPTGEDLVHRVVSLAKRVNEYCRVAIKEGGRFAAPEYVVDAQQKSCQPRSLIAGWSLLSKECTDLIERIEAVQPLVIDHFLTTHTRLRSVGKLLIAGAILECEAAWNMWGVNWNRLDASHCPEEGEIMKARRVGDQWYRYIVHKLVHGLASSKDPPVSEKLPPG